MTTTTHELELAGRRIVIERPTGLKASRALALMRALSKAMPGLQTALAEFRHRYEAENVITLDRVQAKLRYPPRPLERDGAPVLDETGEPVLIPSPVDRLTEEDWTAAGGVYRLPASPSGEEVVVALFDLALETAEEHVYKLLALFTIGNEELKRARRDGRVDELVDERVGELLEDAFADELLELAVVAGEVVDHHFRRKAGELGERLGNALRLVGLGSRTPRTTSPSTSTDTPSSSKPSSSTDSPANTADGLPTSSSTPPSTSSSSSPSSSPATDESASSPSSAAA